MKGKKRETRKEWRSREKRHMADDEDILSSGCKDILNGLRGYPQQAARISSTACEDILTNSRRQSIADGLRHTNY